MTTTQATANPDQMPDVVPCPYCKGEGEGTYWVHSLEYTIEAPCHACKGRGKVDPKDAPQAILDRGDD